MNRKYLLVTATCRFAFPSSITSMTSSGLDTNRSVAPYVQQQQYYITFMKPDTPSHQKCFTQVKTKCPLPEEMLICYKVFNTITTERTCNMHSFISSITNLMYNMQHVQAFTSASIPWRYY